MTNDDDHDWFNIPSKFVIRRWCHKCGIYSDGEQKWSKSWPPWKWDWQYVIPGVPVKIVKEAPPCIVRSNTNASV